MPRSSFMQLPSFARFVPLFASARLTVSRERLHHTAALAPPSHAAARSRHRTRMAGGALLALAMAIPGSGLAQSSSQPATQAEAPAQAPAQANAAAYYYHSPYRRDSTKPQTLPELELSFDYSYMHANLAQSQCGCFGMNGGSTQVVFPFNRILSLAMELTGEQTSQASTSNGGLSLVAFTAGPREEGHHALRPGHLWRSPRLRSHVPDQQRKSDGLGQFAGYGTRRRRGGDTVTPLRYPPGPGGLLPHPAAQ